MKSKNIKYKIKANSIFIFIIKLIINNNDIIFGSRRAFWPGNSDMWREIYQPGKNLKNHTLNFPDPLPLLITTNCCSLFTIYVNKKDNLKKENFLLLLEQKSSILMQMNKIAVSTSHCGKGFFWNLQYQRARKQYQCIRYFNLPIKKNIYKNKKFRDLKVPCL